MAPEKFEEEEKGLLVLAKQWMPRLPFDQVDVLAIDAIGKNISGSGMDTNVVGRKYLDHRAADEEYPKVKKIIVRGLTAETHGNAAGIGLAEFCLSRVVEQMNMQATRVNCLTGGHPTGAMIPLDYETDRETLDMALSTIGLIPPEESRLMWIRDTLDVAEVECSAVYLEEAQQRSDLEVLTPLRDMPFDGDGNLPEVHALAQS